MLSNGIYMSRNFHDKYLKYKSKYLNLKRKQHGGELKFETANVKLALPPNHDCKIKKQENLLKCKNIAKLTTFSQEDSVNVINIFRYYYGDDFIANANVLSAGNYGVVFEYNNNVYKFFYDSEGNKTFDMINEYVNNSIISFLSDRYHVNFTKISQMVTNITLDQYLTISKPIINRYAKSDPEIKKMLDEIGKSFNAGPEYFNYLIVKMEKADYPLSKLKKEHITYENMILFYNQINECIKVLNSKNLYHCDIKSDNILVKETITPVGVKLNFYLADFGNINTNIGDMAYIFDFINRFKTFMDYNKISGKNAIQYNTNMLIDEYNLFVTTFEIFKSNYITFKCPRDPPKRFMQLNDDVIRNDLDDPNLSFMKPIEKHLIPVSMDKTFYNNLWTGFVNCPVKYTQSITEEPSVPETPNRTARALTRRSGQIFNVPAKQIEQTGHKPTEPSKTLKQSMDDTINLIPKEPLFVDEKGTFDSNILLEHRGKIRGADLTGTLVFKKKE